LLRFARCDFLARSIVCLVIFPAGAWRLISIPGALEGREFDSLHYISESYYSITYHHDQAQCAPPHMITITTNTGCTVWIGVVYVFYLLYCMHVLCTWIVLVLAAAVMFGQVNWGSPSKAVGAFKMWELGSQPKPCQSPVPLFSLSLLSLFLGQAVYMGGVDRRTDPEILILLLFYSRLHTCS